MNSHKCRDGTAGDGSCELHGETGNSLGVEGGRPRTWLHVRAMPTKTREVTTSKTRCHKWQSTGSCL